MNGTDLATMESARLSIAPVSETDDPQEFLAVCNSNPDFIDACELYTGKQAYELKEVELFLRQEMNRENSRCLAIRLRETGELETVSEGLAQHRHGTGAVALGSAPLWQKDMRDRASRREKRVGILLGGSRCS